MGELLKNFRVLVSPNLLEVHVEFHPTFSKLHHLFAKEIFKITRAYFFLCIRTIYLYGSGPNKNHQRSSTFLISHLLQLPIQLTILLTDERPVG